MQKYEVGKQFPHTQYLHRGEISVAMLNTNFFDVVCVFSDITAEEKRDWKKGKLDISLFEMFNIPFIIFDFGNWSFDININTHKIKSDEDADRWLNSKANTITLYLVEATTGNLEAMRYISIPLDFAEKIRDICEKQTEQTSEEIDFRINQALSSVTIEMMKKGSIKRFKIR